MCLRELLLSYTIFLYCAQVNYIFILYTSSFNIQIWIFFEVYEHCTQILYRNVIPKSTILEVNFPLVHALRTFERRENFRLYYWIYYFYNDILLLDLYMFSGRELIPRGTSHRFYRCPVEFSSAYIIRHKSLILHEESRFLVAVTF